MIGQQKISAFFKSIPAKKPGVLTSSSASINQSTTDDEHLNANAKLDSETEMAKKRMKSGPCDVGKAQGDGTPVKKPRLDVKQAVSPEQKQRMEDNRMAARMKLAQTNSLGLIKNMGTTWFEALQAEFSKDYFKKLCRFVDKERQKYTIYPPSHQVFSWTQMCDVTDVKVVILGQDPYHGPGQAHGLCFSVQAGVPPPPSLINMYKLLETDIPGFKRPEHGNLTGWAKQGVLLLNACLTVRASQANSHKDQGWEKFTDAVIRWLNNNQKDVVFLLWGSYAQKKGACIDTKKHCVLKGVHPSPLSAHRGFFDCNHFSKANAYLKKKGKAQIDWSSLPMSLL